MSAGQLCTYCDSAAVLTLRILPSQNVLTMILHADRERVVPCCSECAVRCHPTFVDALGSDVAIGGAT